MLAEEGTEGSLCTVLWCCCGSLSLQTIESKIFNAKGDHKSSGKIYAWTQTLTHVLIIFFCLIIEHTSQLESFAASVVHQSS